MSLPAPGLDVMAHQLRWHFRQDGIVATVMLAITTVLRRLGLMQRTHPQSLQCEAVQPGAGDNAGERQKGHRPLEPALKLQPGDWVEVKSLREIHQTLDAQGRHRGLLFMPGMSEYCGRRMRVFKRLDRMMLEATGEMRNVKNTVLLEESICNGVGQRCDRACFHFWREVWLRKIGPRIPQNETS